MKPTSALRSFLCIASSALLTISYSQAATLYWDGGTANIGTPGNGVSFGTTGDWDNTLGENTTNWDQGAGLAHVAWVNANLDTAFFGGTAGNVTLTDPITVGGLGFFSNSGYTITAGAEGLTFGATTNNVRMLNVSGTSSSATISGTVTGSGNMVFTSVAPDVSSTLTLSGTSTGGWSGTTTINAGFTLALSGLNQGLNSTTTSITLNGGNITVTNSAGTAVDNNRISSAAITANGGTLSLANASGANVYAETIGSVALTTGQTNFVFNTNAAGAGSQTLTIDTGGITRPGSTSAVTFSSANFLNTTKNMIVVTGAAATTAGQITGPWATTGNTTAQTDYAVYNGSAQVVPADIAATLETAWTTATNAYTANATPATGTAGSFTLTGTRNITALKSTSASTTVTADIATDYFTQASHVFTDGDVVVFNNGTTMPTGMTINTPYFVRDAGLGGAGTYKLALTSGGLAIDLLGTPAGLTALGALQLTTGNNLGTTGLLNASANTMYITGPGAVTLPSATSDNLHVNAGTGPINISAPITNNATAPGVLTLVKNGSQTLTLSGTNTYTGGTVLNAGSLAIGNVNQIGGATANLTFGGTATLAPSAALNFSGGTLTVNAGAYGTITGSGATAFATTTGTGTLRYTSGSNSATLNLGNASGLTGNLQFRLAGNAGYTTTTIQFSSLGDGVGSALQVGGGNSDSTGLSQRAYITLSGGSAPLVFNNRRIELLPRIASNHTVNTTTLQNNNTNAANTWVINTDLSYQVDQSRNFELAGSNAGDNAFTGLISDGNVGGQINLRKDGAGKWVVSGNNTYTGTTTVNAGTLVLSGTNQYSGATSVSGGTLVGIGANAFGSTSGISLTSTGILSLRGNTNTNFVKASDSTPYTVNNSAGGAIINLDRVSGTGTATMVIGNLTTSSTGGVWGLNFTGANDVSLSAGTLSTPVSTIAAVHTITNNIVGLGSLTLASVFNQATTIASPNLVFAGTGTTIVTGAITQTLTDMDLIKNDAGTLLLNGINTYSGLTSVNAGTLGGTGTIAGGVTVAATAALAPGASAVFGGTLNIGGNLTLTETASDVGTLNFDLGSLANHDKIVVTGTANVGTDALGLSDFTFTNLGGLQNGNYVLIDSGAAIAGPLLAGDLIGTFGGANIELKIVGNDLVLDVTGLGAGSAYDTWKGTNAPGSDPDDDTDGDGVTNAVEFVLGGTSATKDLDKLPVGSTSGANMLFTFKRAVSSIDPKTAVLIETSTDLATWNTAPSPYAVLNTATGPVNPGVTVVEETSPGFDTVTLTVPQAPDAKKFARLKVVITP